MTTSDTAGAGRTGPDGKRVARRHKVFMPVRMTTPHGDGRIHLINLSVTGALAHQATPPSRGTAVGIDLDGRTIAGRIVWVDGRRFGIAFSDRLSEQALHLMFEEPEQPGQAMTMPNPMG